MISVLLWRSLFLIFVSILPRDFLFFENYFRLRPDTSGEPGLGQTGVHTRELTQPCQIQTANQMKPHLGKIYRSQSLQLISTHQNLVE
jgi:hypothetical protein